MNLRSRTERQLTAHSPQLTAWALTLLFAALCASACAGPGGSGHSNDRPDRSDKPERADKPAHASMTTAERLAAGGPAPARFIPLAVGNEWTYEVSAGGQTQRETIHIVGRDGDWFLDDQRGRLRLEVDGVRDRDRYLLRAPVAPGSTWTSVDNLVVQRFELVNVDATLTTPAGKFAHCVIVHNDQPLQGGGRFVTEWSYAPGVGLVALRTFTVGQGQGGAGKEKTQTSLTLTAFKLEKN